MLIIYLAGLMTALYFVSKMLLPEMAKPPLPSRKAASKSKPAVSSSSIEPGNRIEKLETLLAEKNKNIELLQTELKILHIQVRDSNKVKMLLEEEVHRLKELNRIFRSELGLPAAQPKENSIV